MSRCSLLLFGFLLFPFSVHAGSVILTYGKENPKNQEWIIGKGKTHVVMLQLTLSVDQTEDVDVEALHLKAKGTGDESVSIASVWIAEDRDRDGQFDRQDDPVWAEHRYAIDNGTLLVPIRKRFASQTQTDILILYHMGGDFRDFETFGFTVIDVLARGVLSKEYVSMTHLPLSSIRLTVWDPHDSHNERSDLLGDAIFDDRASTPSPLRFSMNPIHMLNRLFLWRPFTAK